MGRQRWETREVDVAAISLGPPVSRSPLGNLLDGEPSPRRKLGARRPACRSGTAGRGGSWIHPHELGELPGLTPELERVAATWAAGQAAERSQRVLELWKANEEKQAALVALKQSEEALHQVWRQVRPPGVGPLITVPSAAPIPEEAHRDPAGGYSKAKCRSRSERARARDAASLVAGGPMRASGSPEEPLTPEGNQPPRGTGRKPLQARRPGRGKPRGPDETGTTWAGEPN